MVTWPGVFQIPMSSMTKHITCPGTFQIPAWKNGNVATEHVKHVKQLALGGNPWRRACQACRQFKAGGVFYTNPHTTHCPSASSKPGRSHVPTLHTTSQNLGRLPSAQSDAYPNTHLTLCPAAKQMDQGLAALRGRSNAPQTGRKGTLTHSLRVGPALMLTGLGILPRHIGQDVVHEG